MPLNVSFCNNSTLNCVFLIIGENKHLKCNADIYPQIVLWPQSDSCRLLMVAVSQSKSPLDWHPSLPSTHHLWSHRWSPGSWLCCWTLCIWPRSDQEASDHLEFISQLNLLKLKLKFYSVITVPKLLSKIELRQTRPNKLGHLQSL